MELQLHRDDSSCELTVLCFQGQLNITISCVSSVPVRGNPVAGLLETAEDLCYSSAVDWLTSSTGLIEIDKEFQWLI